jgi:hypothetical protein
MGMGSAAAGSGSTSFHLPESVSATSPTRAPRLALQGCVWYADEVPCASLKQPEKPSRRAGQRQNFPRPGSPQSLLVKRAGIWYVDGAPCCSWCEALAETLESADCGPQPANMERDNQSRFLAHEKLDVGKSAEVTARSENRGATRFLIPVKNPNAGRLHEQRSGVFNALIRKRYVSYKNTSVREQVHGTSGVAC